MVASAAMVASNRPRTKLSKVTRSVSHGRWSGAGAVRLPGAASDTIVLAASAGGVLTDDPHCNGKIGLEAQHAHQGGRATRNEADGDGEHDEAHHAGHRVDALV